VFGEHVLAVDLVLPDGSERRVVRDDPLFHAVLGGFGMLGVVTALEMQLHRVHSGRLDVTAVPCASLGRLFDAFEERESEADYLVGWVDAFHRHGRGVVHSARHFEQGEDPVGETLLSAEGQRLPVRFFGVVPRALMGPLLQPFGSDFGVRWIDRTRYASARLRGRHRFRQSHAAFAVLLDHVPDW
jgi:hypothetical protein